jgi:ABC-type amino acid transport substrate-binding protein
MKILIINILFYLCISSISFSQAENNDTLRVNTMYLDHSDPAFKIYSFEHEFFTKLVELYNTRHNNKFIVKYKYFKKFNDLLKSLDNSTYACVYGQITIGFIDNVDYSIPYLPVRNSLIKRKSDTIDLRGKEKILIGFIEHSYYRDLYNRLLKNYNVKDTTLLKNNYEKLAKLLENGNIDCYIGDSIDAWVNDKFNIILHVDETTNYLGLLYPKSSKLKKEFDTVIKYYTGTKSFYNLLKKYFGDEFAIYYKQSFQNQP